jgi:hydroxyethylthiazole kinase-like uncharacterized protein yjeF
MQAAEQAIFDAGTSVDELMDIAGSGAAEWIRRVAAGRSVTVLCGPGNNGGDGYVIARRMEEFGNAVSVVAPLEPTTDAARNARKRFKGSVQTSGKGAAGDLLVDCLFGSGLSRPLSGEHALLLRDLAERHAFKVAVDLPSGVESDSGALLNERLPEFDLTLCLGAWKFAHWKLPARRIMGAKRLVPIGVDPTPGAAQLVGRPNLAPPGDEAHKYSRGLCLVIAGAMPGASLLSCQAAMRAGAGYVQLASEAPSHADPDLVIQTDPLKRVLDDRRIDALLVGPGLGRDSAAAERLGFALQSRKPCVIDADALILLKPDMIASDAQVLLTPHDGELESLCRSFSVVAKGRQDRAQALAKASGAVVLAKGPDSVIADLEGRIALVPPASSWLSVAGSGDVLAGIAVSRMAAGSDAFGAACEAAWLHGAAARLSEAPFTASQLAHGVQSAYAAAL